jgi:hypothetical protein
VCVGRSHPPSRPGGRGVPPQALVGAGGFDESDDAEHEEDFALQLRFVADGMRVVTGDRTLSIAASGGTSW